MPSWADPAQGGFTKFHLYRRGARLTARAKWFIKQTVVCFSNGLILLVNSSFCPEPMAQALRLPRSDNRLPLPGALNWRQHWFRQGGRSTPRSIARSFIRLLRDTGMEVVYTPPRQDIPAVVKLALEEDADSPRDGATGSRECRKQVFILRRPCVRCSTLPRVKDLGSSCDQHITPEGVSEQVKPSSSHQLARHRR